MSQRQRAAHDLAAVAAKGIQQDAAIPREQRTAQLTLSQRDGPIRTARAGWTLNPSPC